MAGVDLQKAGEAQALTDDIELWSTLPIGHSGKLEELDPSVLARRSCAPARSPRFSVRIRRPMHSSRWPQQSAGC
jgi:hypothetical protein